MLIAILTSRVASLAVHSGPLSKGFGFSGVGTLNPKPDRTQLAHSFHSTKREKMKRRGERNVEIGLRRRSPWEVQAHLPEAGLRAQ